MPSLSPAADNVWVLPLTDAPLELPVPPELPGTAPGPLGSELNDHGLRLAKRRGTAPRGKGQPDAHLVFCLFCCSWNTLPVWSHTVFPKTVPFLFFYLAIRWKKDKWPTSTKEFFSLRN